MILNILAMVLSINCFAQNDTQVPVLISGKKISDELKARYAPREKCCVIGVFLFKVEPNGSVDSVICKGTGGKPLDSLQTFEIKQLKFKPFTLIQDVKTIQWFQIKIYGTSLTHNSPEYIRDIVHTFYDVFDQEKEDYFSNGKKFLIENGVTILPPIWLPRRQ
jgi:hypothetical protein